MPFKQRVSASKCQKHSSKICDRYCKQCDISICVQCSSSKEHKSHEFAYMVETLNNHKEIILEDLQELEKSICHEYPEIASDLSIQKAELNENSQKLTTKN